MDKVNELAEKYHEFEFLQELKTSGKAGKTGFSYHDTADLLDRILTRHPEVDYVQLQVNYLDWESEAIQARRCCQTACKHHKKVIVMEPLKGGTLAQIPENAEKLLHTLDSRFDADRGGLAATKYAAPKCGRNKTADSDFDKHSKNCPENSLPGKLTTSEPSVFVPSTASYGLRFVLSALCQRIMCAPAWSESVAAFRKLFFIYGREFLRNRLLNHSVYYRWHS